VAGSRGMLRTDALKRYVISLKPRRTDHTPDDLARAIRELPGVNVIEGEGLSAVTVEMPESTADLAHRRLPFATVSDYLELELL